MPSFEEYGEKYPDIRMERKNGIVQMTLNTDGGPFTWTARSHQALGDAFEDVGSDRENKVVILTGTGDNFLTNVNYPMPSWTPGAWDTIIWRQKRVLMRLLDIEMPIIAAVNGPATVHSEVPVLCDIVLAAESAYFQDSRHILWPTVPGDGVQIVWPHLLGTNRGRYFLLTGQKLSAQECLSLGVVNEVLPDDQLLARAWELAEQLAKHPGAHDGSLVIPDGFDSRRLFTNHGQRTPAQAGHNGTHSGRCGAGIGSRRLRESP